MTILGDKIKEERSKRFTVRGFAREIGVTPPFITDIEAGRRLPGPEVMSRIAKALELPLEELASLDHRVTPGIKELMEDEPRVAQLLRKLTELPDLDEVLKKMERDVAKESRKVGEKGDGDA